MLKNFGRKISDKVRCNQLDKLYFEVHSEYSKKKIGVLPNPKKRFRRCLKVSKGVRSLKKRIKISKKPLKVLPVYPSEEASSAKPFFKLRTAGKGFAGEYSSLGYTGRTFKGFVDIFILF